MSRFPLETTSASLLQHGVQSDGRAVDDGQHCRRRDLETLHRRAQAGHHATRGIVGRAGFLVVQQRARFQVAEHDVGEGSTDIDPNAESLLLRNRHHHLEAIPRQNRWFISRPSNHSIGCFICRQQPAR